MSFPSTQAAALLNRQHLVGVHGNAPKNISPMFGKGRPYTLQYNRFPQKIVIG
jgi:hypothetical protein